MTVLILLAVGWILLGADRFLKVRDNYGDVPSIVIALTAMGCFIAVLVLTFI